MIAEVRRRGLFHRVSFAVVHLEREQELGQRLTSGGPIPQLIFYRRTPTGWLRRCLIGGQSVQTVEEMINQEVTAADQTKKADATASPKVEPAKEPTPEQSAANGTKIQTVGGHQN